MRALVTGGSGFLGRHVVERLRRDGHEVTVLCRDTRVTFAGENVRIVGGSLEDEHSLDEACEGQDVVFHVAARAGYWGDPADYHRVNVGGTDNLIDACERSGVGKLVYTSSASVVFDGRDLEGADESVSYASRPMSPYQKTKIIAEASVLEADRRGRLRAAVLRPHIIWGPGDRHILPRIVARARAGTLKVIGDGRNLIDVVWVENAADAHVLAAVSDRAWGNAYFISQGTPVRFWDWINTLLEAIGEPAASGRIPYRAARCIGAVLEKTYAWCGLPGEPVMTRFLASELARSHYFDITAARSDLGYVPRVSVSDGIARLAAWYRGGGRNRRG